MPDSKIILETQRLNLREFTSDDASFVVELLNSPGWLQYIGDRNVRTEDEAITYLENGPMKSYAENGYGLWLVESKRSLSPMGMCGILNREELDSPDIGYAILPQYQSQGFAQEAVSATLKHAGAMLRMSKLSAIVQSDNNRSIALLIRNGFSFEGLFSFPGKKEVLQLYVRDSGIAVDGQK